MHHDPVVIVSGLRPSTDKIERTLMLSVAAGHDTKYLTDTVGGGREAYYTGAVAAGEPAGLWYGTGAAALGLAGEVDAELMEGIYSNLVDPRDPAAFDRAQWGEAAMLGNGHREYRPVDEIYGERLAREPHAGPERRAEIRRESETAARQAVGFYDATFSAPKSVSVLGIAFERMANTALMEGRVDEAAAWSAYHKAVEDAVMAGAQASIDYLERVSGYSRIGHHGGGSGRWIDAHAWTVAQFLQHDSRDHDPQLHVHQAILNRVLCSDGQWRALDGKALWEFKAAAGAMGERTMEAHLAQSMGVHFETRPDGRAREIMGVDRAVMDEFSSRRRAITPVVERALAAYEARTGRPASQFERAKIAQEATLSTRQAKAHAGETSDERLARWERMCQDALVGGLTRVAHDALEYAKNAPEAAMFDPKDVLARALETAAKSRSTWGMAAMVKAVSDELPGHLRMKPEHVGPMLEKLAERGFEMGVPTREAEPVTDLPDSLKLEDGRSSFERPGWERRATPGQIAAEKMLREAAVARGAVALSAKFAESIAARYAENDAELSADQRAALLGVLTSGAHVETLCAAAGTGKSFAVGAIAEAWEESGRRALGLATSEIATEILRGEGLDARNVSAWLEGQQRLAEGRGIPGDEAYSLRTEDLLVVDEASMTSTADLARVHELCSEAGAKLLLVGDPHQLGAVGPGGALSDVVAAGLTYELTEVRRFSEEWEREASLRLRAGDPDAIQAYYKHGRLVDGGTREQAATAAERAWLADTLEGKESLLMVGSNDEAARVSAELRAQLVAHGRVSEAGVPLKLQGTMAGEGDLVQARKNGWDQLGHEGNTRAPINRQTFRVTGLREDGGLTVEPNGGGSPIHLTADYVAEHLALGYASTVHAAQGRTVDTAHAVLDKGWNAQAAYVALTRGRDGNTAWTTTVDVPRDAEVGEAHDAKATTARSFLEGLVDSAELERSAMAEQDQAAIDARSTMTHGDRLAAGVAAATAGRTEAWLDELEARGELSDRDRARLAADPAMDTVERLVRRAELAGHDAREVLASAVAERDFEGTVSPAQALHWRIRSSVGDEGLVPKVKSYADLIPPAVDSEWRTWLEARAADADDRRRELGAQTAAEPPQWALEALGAVPDDAVARAEWEHKAGYAAAYREQARHTDDNDALGSAPAIPERHALWRAGHEALDLPEAGADERAKSDAALRATVTGWEREQAWAPKWVADELAETSKRAESRRDDATLWSSRAEVTEDEAEAARLREEAAWAGAEADALEQRTRALDDVDTQRAEWFLHTAETRAAADRARACLSERGVDLDTPESRVTGEQWWEEHCEERTADEAVRPVTEADVDEVPVGELPPVPFEDLVDAAETDVPDIRETAVPNASEHADVEPVRIPTAEESAAEVARARDSLLEIHARNEWEASQEQAHSEELGRWADTEPATDSSRDDSAMVDA